MLAQIEVAPAVELHDPPPHRHGIGGELVVVYRLGGWHVEDPPAGVAQSLAEVGLVGVDEEARIQEAHLLRRLPPYEHRARLGPADLAHPIAAALDGVMALQSDRGGQRPAESR